MSSVESRTEPADLSAALRASEERLRLIQAAARIGSFDYDMVTGRVFRSPEYLEVQGLPADSPLEGVFSDDWLKRVHPLDREQVKQWAAADFAVPCEFAREYRIIRPSDGETRWIYNRGQVAGDADGRPIRMISAQTDITDRKLGELRSRYMTGLSDALRQAATSRDAMRAACEHLGRYLDVSRVGFGEVDDSQSYAEVNALWTAKGGDGASGHFRLSEFPTEVLERFRTGDAVITEDVELLGEDSEVRRIARRIGARSGIDLPLLRQGRLVAILAVHHDQPRAWTEHDLSIARLTAERTHDAVERAHAEVALRESEERMRLAVAGTGLGFYDFDLRSGDGVWSDSTFALLGLPVPSDRHAHVQMWRQRIHPEDVESIWAQRGEAAQRGGALKLETRIVRADDGRVRWLTITGQFLGPPHARRSVGIALDITERKEAELRQAFLLRVSDRLRGADDPHTATRDIANMLAETLGVETVGFAQIEEEGRVASILSGVTAGDPPALREMRLENGRGPLAGAALPDLMAGRTFTVADIASDPRTASSAEAIRENARAAAAMHVPLMRGGRLGAVLFVHALSPRAWTASEVRLVEEVAERTWEAIGRARAEQALRDANDRLEQQVAAAVAEREAALVQLHQAQKLETIGQLTGGIAHDFNNLLTPITGALDLLRHRFQSDERLERLIGGAMQSAERARTLVQRLLGFARRQPLQPVPIDVAKLIEGMRDLIGSSIGRDIVLQIGSEDGLPPALADANQLELAILNLCVNARDAMPGGGVLAVRAEPASAFVRVTVEDNGSGMDAETVARAVEPFFSTKSQERGTGLGLSMVHGLMGQLGGSMEIDSAPGAGTRVHLMLPVATEAPRVAEVRPAAVGRLPQLAILLVDDEDLVRAGTAEMLRDLGHEVDTARSGEGALRCLADAKFDLVVTDVMMPGMSGTELAARIADEWPGLPVLLITGFLGTADKAEHLPRLSKPFGRDELAAALARVMGVAA